MYFHKFFIGQSYIIACSEFYNLTNEQLKKQKQMVSLNKIQNLGLCQQEFFHELTSVPAYCQDTGYITC